MVNFFKTSALALGLALMLGACSGKKADENAAPPEKTPAEASAPDKPSAEDKAANDAEAEKKKDNAKDRVGAAYAALYCSGALANPGAGSDIYKKHGFKSAKHFMKVWSLYAKKDSDWAQNIAAKAEEADCKK